MANRRNLMSDNLKEEIAKELGVYDKVKQDGGWEKNKLGKIGDKLFNEKPKN